MAARWPPTPSPRVTATGVDSAGPIGHAHKGIDFCPRMGYDWAYLKRAPTQLQLPRGARYSEDFDGFKRRSDVKLRCHFRTPIFLVCEASYLGYTLGTLQIYFGYTSAILQIYFGYT